MKIKQNFIPNGRKNRPARVNPMRYITVHETDNTKITAGADNHAFYLKGDDAANKPVSWHYTVDENSIVQHLPENEDAFHAGDGAGTGNRQSIAIEMCVNQGADFKKTLERTIELIADICIRRNIPLINVVQHSKWSGKNCPSRLRTGMYMTWDNFKYKILDRINSQQPTPKPTPEPDKYENADRAIATLHEKNIINSPDYWKKQVNSTEWLGKLLNEVVKNLK